MTQLLFFNLGTGEIIIIALVVLLLFGGKKIPELMGGLGKGVRSFKKGMNEPLEDEQEENGDQEEKKEQKAKGERDTSDATSSTSAEQ